MEENLSGALQMVFMVFLFVFALTGAVMRYNAINDTAENLISINMVNRRGTATNSQLEASDVRREADYAEIAMSILNLEDNQILTGNMEYKVIIDVNGKICEASYIQEEDEMTGMMVGKIKLNVPEFSEQKFSVDDLSGVTTNEISNFVSFVKSVFKNYKFNVEYTENTIKYTSTTVTS